MNKAFPLPKKRKPLRCVLKGGFTLIEVLIALAIVSIAMTAIIKSTTQNIHDTSYLQKKTIASWVGTQVIRLAQIGQIKLPQEPETLQEETDMLGQKWKWEANLAPTPNPNIQKIQVLVFQSSEDKPVINLTGYFYAQ